MDFESDQLVAYAIVALSAFVLATCVESCVIQFKAREVHRQVSQMIEMVETLKAELKSEAVENGQEKETKSD
jgi:hypothetical protein